MAFIEPMHRNKSNITYLLNKRIKTAAYHSQQLRLQKLPVLHYHFKRQVLSQKCLNKLFVLGF